MKLEHPRHGEVISGPFLDIKGLAFAPAGIESVTIQIGTLVRPAKHGVHRADIAKAFPKHPALADAGFYCRLSPQTLANLRKEMEGRRAVLTITTQARDGQNAKLESDLRLGPGVPFDNSVKDITIAPMLLNVDRAVVSPKGVLKVTGWLISNSPIESIAVYAGSRSLGAPKIGLVRTDVASAWPAYPNALHSGFSLLADLSTLPAAPDIIRVVALDTTGKTQEVKTLIRHLQESTTPVPNGIAQLFCDEAFLTSSGDLNLGGWAIATAGVGSIKVVLEGELLGDAAYGHERQDVAKKFPKVAGSRRSGFKFVSRVGPREVGTEHRVLLETILLDGNVRRDEVVVTITEAVQQAYAADASEISLNIDAPQIANGTAVRPVEGTLTISGWAVSRDSIGSISFDIDGRPLGKAYLGIRREDVARTFPEYENALLSGFAFSIPPRSLSRGKHRIGLRVKSKLGKETRSDFEIEVTEIAEHKGPWSIRTALSIAEQSLIQSTIAQFKFAPKFYVFLDVRRRTLDSLIPTLRSIANQVYDSWIVLVVGAGKRRRKLDALIHTDFLDISSKIRYSASQKGPRRDLNSANPEDFFLPLDPGDVLGVNALFEFAVGLNREQHVDFMYADDRRINPATGRIEAFFKPDWSPTLMLSTNYIGRPWCASLALLRKTGLDELFEKGPIGNFDLVLRCTELADKIVHLPDVLAERNPAIIEADDDEKAALRGAIARQQLNWTVEPGLIQKTYRCRPKSPAKGLVSIIIPTCAAKGLIKTCIESIRDVSTYKNIEIICVDNILDEASEWKAWLRDNCDVVVEIIDTFNWSRFNNLAAREASGSYLLFLNDDIEVIQPNWLEAMLDQVTREEVGAVGPQLLYPDRKVQHAGMFLAGSGIARHAFRFCQENEIGYFGLAQTQRDVIAVTGACMLVRAEVFNALSGFDEAHSVTNNDVDFCLRAHEQGLRIVYTPFARLIHHELVSRKELKDEHDASAFTARWRNIFSTGDPYFHPRLDKWADDYRVDSEPTEIIFAGRPQYRKETVKRVLAVKLDHIGDFVTAFPAFQRLKSIFPQAELVALVAPASRHLASLEPSIDRIITYEFFHSLSQLGVKDADENALAELKRELSALKFHIAVDLRKHPDTRNILKYANAEITAGFDYRSQFPWLDVALNWEGDVELIRKHHHISDDLVNLVEAIGTAGDPQRSAVRRSDQWVKQQAPVITRLRRKGLFTRKLVCVHPAVGNEMRQWPPSHFADLIGALLACEDVDVALVGGPDELAIAKEVLDHLPIDHRLHNLVGAMKLDELPFLFEASALFIGNNSGPKHIAAAVGVPTIGIHSDVVDAREWGPLGDFAVAVQRNMTCGPCYVATREQCYRGLACLHGLDPPNVISVCRKLLMLNRGVLN